MRLHFTTSQSATHSNGGLGQSRRATRHITRILLAYLIPGEANNFSVCYRPKLSKSLPHL